MDSSAFSKASDQLTDSPTIKSKELVKDTKHFVVGDNGSKDLLLSEYEPNSCCEKKRPFMGKHGSIGPNGKFPYVSKYPEVDDEIDEDIKNECFGANADIDASINSETYITIGKTGSPEDCSPSCYSNIRMSEIVTPKASFVQFEGQYQQIEGHTAYFHQTKDVSILINTTEVVIYPGSSKRRLNIYPCTSDFKRYENTPSNSRAFFKDITYSNQSSICVSKICSSSNTHNFSKFTHLIERQDPATTSAGIS